MPPRTDFHSVSGLPCWKSVRPHALIRSASPVKTIERSSSTKLTQPFVWPGVAITSTHREPNRTLSPPTTYRSALAPAALAITDCTLAFCLRIAVPVMWSAWQCVLRAATSFSPCVPSGATYLATSARSRSAVRSTGSMRIASFVTESARRYVYVLDSFSKSWRKMSGALGAVVNAAIAPRTHCSRCGASSATSPWFARRNSTAVSASPPWRTAT
mmetsp:Transcript_23918/g.61614  ORF Transcript_23918/g.61614 Transcript_23918/m.61614 type:complete len:215 (-) Transcript_23918:368-1012(-)